MKMETVNDLLEVRAANERAILREARKWAMLKLLGLVVDEGNHVSIVDPKIVPELLDTFLRRLLMEAENLVRMEAAHLSLLETHG